MPELPEVETVVRGLRSSLPGRNFREVRFGKTDFVEGPEAIAERLPGMRVAEVTRMGKFICIAVEPSAQQAEAATATATSTTTIAPFYLIVHLGMTGKLAVRPAAEPILPHTHVFFALDDGRELRYTDARRFGRMLLVEGSALAEFSGNLGREPLEIGAEEFYREFSSRRARLKALLLDQSVLRGVGNIYADESLFRARLHPARIAENVTKDQLLLLHQKVRAVLEEAILARGSSVSDYVDAEGKRGKFQQRHRVYQRDGLLCFRCHAMIKRTIVAGRSSHFCPKCQPAPRGRKVAGKRVGKKAGKGKLGSRKVFRSKSGS